MDCRYGFLRVLLHFEDFMYLKLGFPTGRDSAEVPSLFRDKGTTGQAKNLPRDRTGRDSQNSGRDGLGKPKSGTGRGTKRDRAEKEYDVLKQKTLS